MAKFLLYLDRIINLYLFFIVVALLLSIVPNINPDYPLFHFVFMCAGMNLKLPVVGAMFSPMLIMVSIVLVSTSLRKTYLKLYEKNVPEIIVWTREDFEKNLKLFKEQTDKNSNMSTNKEEDEAPFNNLTKEKEKEEEKRNDN